MNTVLSSFDGLTLLAFILLAAVAIAYYANGHTLRRRHAVMRGTGDAAHVVSRHYSQTKAHAAYRAYSAQNTESGVFTISSQF